MEGYSKGKATAVVFCASFAIQALLIEHITLSRVHNRNPAHDYWRNMELALAVLVDFMEQLMSILIVRPELRSFLGLQLPYSILMGFLLCSVPFPHFARREMFCQQGCSLGNLQLSRSTIVYIKHNDMDSLRGTLEKVTQENKDAKKLRRYIVVEAVYQIEKTDFITAAMGHPLATEGGCCAGNTRDMDHQCFSSSRYVFSASLAP